MNDDELKEFNGILPFIPGQYLARASYYLPAPETVTEKFMDVDLVLRIRYERMSSRHGKNVRHFWSPDCATVEPPAGVEPRGRQGCGRIDSANIGEPRKD